MRYKRGEFVSMINNRQTLEHYLGQVWLTRPRPFAGAEYTRQGVNVCVESNGDFVAIDHLLLAPDGVYHSKETAIGRREDDSFRRYIEKLAGVNGMSEAALYQQVCDCYTACGDIPGVARALGLLETRVRRILITKGMLTSDLIEKIAWLYDGGRGTSVAEIARMLKVSESTVHKNMAYQPPPSTSQ